MSAIFLGLMSGTSVDSVDVSLIDLAKNNVKILNCQSRPIPMALKKDILKLISSKEVDQVKLSIVDKKIAITFSNIVKQVLNDKKISHKDIVAIGSHGQTIKHSPNQVRPFSIQLGNGQEIANRTLIKTVSDFRSADIRAGGQGAPLTPVFHQKMFAKDLKRKLIINLGGIANITLLDPETNTIGFDTGPGNCLLDSWIRRHKNKEYDKSGRWAASGKVQEELLVKMLEDCYFEKTFPKSTGNDYFNTSWIDKNIKLCNRKFNSEDVQSTLNRLTVKTITSQISNLCNQKIDVYLCGGGVHNSFLVSEIEKSLGYKVSSTQTLGIDPDYVEAISFAWFAYQRINNNSFNLSEITGSKGKILLGEICDPVK